MSQNSKQEFVNIRKIIRRDHCKAYIPWLREFVVERIRICEPEASSLTSESLFDAYQEWLQIKTEDKQTRFLVTYSRFCRQVGSMLPGQARKVRTNGKMTYLGISLNRPRRATKGVEEDLVAKAKEYLENGYNDVDVPIKVQRVYDKRGAGRCAFASRSIEKGEIVTEFVGEVVNLDEMARREEIYRERGWMPATLVVCQYNKAIDPHARNPLHVSAMLNHSMRNSNLKMIPVRDANNNIRVVMVAKTCIPQGVELLFNYGDPDAPFYEFSQTIPRQQ